MGEFERFLGTVCLGIVDTGIVWFWVICSERFFLRYSITGSSYSSLGAKTGID